MRYLLYQPLWKQVLHKLLEELLGHSVMEEGDLAVDDPQYGWRAVGPKVIGQTPLIAHVHNTNAHACIHRYPHTMVINGPATLNTRTRTKAGNISCKT